MQPPFPPTLSGIGHCLEPLQIPTCAAKTLYPIIKQPWLGRKGGQIRASPGNPPGAESGLSFRKKALYYGLMLFLTLLALEGMAWLAYCAAYGQWYGRGRLETPKHITPPPQ